MIQKFIRFLQIYGLRRALIKALGRLRLKVSLLFLINPFYVLFPPKKTVGILGAGQFAYATVGFFLIKRRLGKISKVFDINADSAQTFANMYRCDVSTSYQDLIAETDYVYILSNHASHTQYAIEALNNGKVVYCEKPISVSHEQLLNLYHSVKQTPDNFFCGYNRPHSHIIKKIRQDYAQTLKAEPITLSCYISGHDIPNDHWYRVPTEGTRVCGNLGHWIDLFISLIWDRVDSINSYKLNIVSSDADNPDDNCSLLLTSDLGDLLSIVISSRSEPFEGINETINLQAKELNVKIDDFRKAKVNYKHDKFTIGTAFKDVGHDQAISQPFSGQGRSYREYFFSSYLTITFASMIQKKEVQRELSLEQIKAFYK